MTDEQLSAVNDALTTLTNADHWVLVAVKTVESGHQFELHYTSPLVIATLTQYAQSVSDAWVDSANSEEQEDED